MKQFDFYEFTGILVPGSTLFVGIFFLYPDFFKPESIKDLSFGGLGLFSILAYVLGHLVQAVGDFLECVWWKLWGGMPCDWIRTKSDQILSLSQVNELEKMAENRLGLGKTEFPKLDANQWYNITRQIYADVSGRGRATRIDIFNGNYGLNRGIATGLLIVTVASVFKSPANWSVFVIAGICSILAVWRMHRFARHYARELFVQFLQLPEKNS